LGVPRGARTERGAPAGDACFGIYRVRRCCYSRRVTDTGVVIDPRYAEHDTGTGHPERPDRIKALLPLMDAPGAHLVSVAARLATGEELALVHDGAYVKEVAATEHDRPWHAFDADPPPCPRSYFTARLAAGGFLALLDAVMQGTVDNGFAFVRPPGHHAERQRAMGFCLFNNVAVGAEYLRHRYGLERILIVDWDLHHGNGTQHMFEADRGVLYVSTHQSPYYPGTGMIDEVGRRDGEGYTVNLPFPAGFGDAEYGEAFTRIVEPIAHQYAPQFVLISAGFDAHARDPLGGMELTEAGFRAMARALLGVARSHAAGRCAAILEGGYDLTAIRHSSQQVLDELVGDAAPIPATGSPSRAGGLLDRVQKVHGRYWKL
jgi:acetoin utilization deacetylase AcuC-like enzyme